MTDTGNQPIHRIRRGRLGASIFENTSRDGETYLTAQFDRSYRDGEDWKHTKSFGKNDLLSLAKLIDLTETWAQAWTSEQAQNSRPAAEPGRDGP